MNSFINEFKTKYLILKNILKIYNKKIKFIFYSENKTYQKYSYSIIELLADKYPNQIYYVSSDINDQIKSLKVHNLFLGTGILMNFFFLIVKAENFFLTLTDLNNHAIKKTKNIDKYIYYFHAPVSTFKNYTKSAFDNYDIILCNGKYHVEEIQHREKLKNLKKKKLILTGYFYFDYLLEKLNISNNPDEILVAPSWNYKHKNFINENFLKIIDNLIKKNHNVTFRPHPEHFKRSKKTLNNIKIKFADNKNFKFDEDYENIKSMEKAKCLITDSSGISIEYILLLNRPVLYLEDVEKIHNEDFFDFKNFVSIDQKIKNNFGLIFYEKDIYKIDLLINESIINFKSKTLLLNQFIEENFFNFGKTKKGLKTILENQILNNG